MPETISPPSALPPAVAPPPFAGDAAPFPAPSGAVLRRLAHNGALSAEALEAALRFLGIRPGVREWAAFWRHTLTLCGGVLLACGVVFFIAWNWADMHRYAKFALLQGLISGSALLALWRGLDTPSGRLSLLAAGILVGPLQAVYGQAYMTGADPWELFRSWTLLLLPFALAGQQTGLWFLTWLTGTLWGVLYLGRLDLPWTLFLVQAPEFIMAQAAFLIAWEGAARRREATQTWLGARWLPRLVLFLTLGCLTASVCALILWSDSGHLWVYGHSGALFLPADPVNYLLYAAALAGIWVWYRRRRPDLFMLGCALLAVDGVLAALLVKAEFMTRPEISALLAWGLIISGLSAGNGTLLRRWQRDMERGAAARRALRPGASGFFSGQRAAASWGEIWERLRALGLASRDETPPLAAPAGVPWYVRAMQAFGGWIASLLFIGCLVLFLKLTLRIRSNAEGPLLLGGLVILGLGLVVLRASGVLMRQFGLSSALAGAGAVSVALGLLFRHSDLWPAAAALGAFLGYPFARSGIFRGLAATAGFSLLALGLRSVLWGAGLWGYGLRHSTASLPGAALQQWAMTGWWSALCVGLAWCWAQERHWGASRDKSALLVPLLHGAYASLAIHLAAGLLAPSVLGHTAAAAFSSRELGLAAGIGLMALAFWLTRELPLSSQARPACIAAAALSAAGGWYLPGAALFLLGLAISRHAGNPVFLGCSAFFLFAYLGHYYYALSTSLLHKSWTLMGAGAVLLALGALLPGVPAGPSAEGTAEQGGAHA